MRSYAISTQFARVQQEAPIMHVDQPPPAVLYSSQFWCDLVHCAPDQPPDSERQQSLACVSSAANTTSNQILEGVGARHGRQWRDQDIRFRRLLSHEFLIPLAS